MLCLTSSLQRNIAFKYELVTPVDSKCLTCQILLSLYQISVYFVHLIMLTVKLMQFMFYSEGLLNSFISFLNFSLTILKSTSSLVVVTG